MSKKLPLVFWSGSGGKRDENNMATRGGGSCRITRVYRFTDAATEEATALAGQTLPGISMGSPQWSVDRVGTTLEDLTTSHLLRNGRNATGVMCCLFWSVCIEIWKTAEAWRSATEFSLDRVITGGRGRMRRGWNAFWIAPTTTQWPDAKVRFKRMIQPMTWHPKMEVFFFDCEAWRRTIAWSWGVPVDLYLPWGARAGVRSRCV